MKRQITMLLLPIGLVIFFLTFGNITIAAPGDLDPTFSGDGKRTDRISELDCGGLAVAVQSDGKIVAAGWSDNGSGDDFALIRYNTDGSLDTSFDGDGKVTTTIGTASIGAEPDAEAYAVAIQSDGKIVAAGSSESLGNNDFAVVRYNPDGSLDTSFDGDGKVTTPIGSGSDFASALAIQSDGKLVVSGFGSTGTSSAQFAVVRYNPNGSLDTSFDGDGKVTTQMGTGYGGASAVAIQDGKIVAVGSGSTTTSSFFAVVRYNPNGSLDTSFDGDGKVTTQVGSGYNGAFSVAIDSDGKIVAAGRSGNSGSFITYFAVARYNNDGSLDTSFDGDGKLTTSISSGNDGATAVVIQPDGKLVAAGAATNNPIPDFAIVRYNTDGSLDTAFGGGDGNTTVDFNNSSDIANGMALDGQGRAVVVGGSNGSFALARLSLLEPNKVRFDFDGDGRSDVSVFRPSNSVWYLSRSSAGFTSVQFGISTDDITPADFDGDGKTDIAVFRQGTWWRMNSSNEMVTTDSFGLPGDIPVPADYTGDGRDELAVYRNGQWWALDLSNNQSSLINFGLATDKPVAADYDGDGRVDQAVYRNGEWHINGSTIGYTVALFGLPNDRPVVGDYDGDGKADLAVYRDGTWYLQQSTAGFSAFQWGLSTDIPTPADYDGDGKTDAGVYRDGVWYLLQTTSGVSIQQFGLPNDKPAPSAFIPSP